MRKHPDYKYRPRRKPKPAPKPNENVVQPFHQPYLYQQSYFPQHINPRPFVSVPNGSYEQEARSAMFNTASANYGMQKLVLSSYWLCSRNSHKAKLTQLGIKPWINNFKKIISAIFKVFLCRINRNFQLSLLQPWQVINLL
ncbi:hypothetical protein CDAR_614811 [Caerostris darwini]|uniref:Uncharacterized protein n=1 Tax=Caerostris darwini TaxID=1538125 RepID=A0AAV4U4J3_9ARAC|nr:hypothetical protein CDAR_614811 [Caerostris darwini]